jgi:hypothetical protein
VKTWYRVQGDVQDTLMARLDGVVDLVSATGGEAHVSLCGELDTTLVLTVTDALARIVTVQLSPWLNSAVPGAWDLEFQVNFGAMALTWPSKGFDRIMVRVQGG